MHQLPFTALLNHLFAGPVTALLTALGLHPAHPTAPIPDHVAMQILVFLILILFFVAVRASLSVEKPEHPAAHHGKRLRVHGLAERRDHRP